MALRPRQFGAAITAVTILVMGAVALPPSAAPSGASQYQLPKPNLVISVPFGGDPCRSLTAANLLALLHLQTTATKVSTTLHTYKLSPKHAKGDTCEWTAANVTVEYVPKTGFLENAPSNRFGGTDSKPAPKPAPKGSYLMESGSESLFINQGNYYFEVGGPFGPTLEAVGAAIAKNIAAAG